ncbi:MAG: sigma-70 family RNA polymerase sigma factor [Pyrinomonadaceae bacterium]
MTTPSITELLIDWSNGDLAAQEHLFPLVENELHKMARRYMRQLNRGNTLQTTAVINEIYLKLVDQDRVKWQNRAHFFGIAASMMRRFLLNYLRDKKRLKRGGENLVVSLSEAMIVSNEKSNEILALEEALTRLSKIDNRKARVVELRFYGGLSVEETAEVLQISGITVMRDWTMAKAWLAKEIGHGK